jgi:hypothetical protein
MEPSKPAVKVDNPEPETEPVTFVDITLNCGRVMELAVKPRQGDEWEDGVDYHIFSFPKFHLTQKIWHREVAAISVRESVITKLPPPKEKA